MARIVLLYIVAFAALTATDIGSTLWATAVSKGQEFNPAVATSDGMLHVERLLIINGAFLAVTAGLLIWAMRNTDRIDPRYLAWPELALFNYFYINPFNKTNLPKSVFHYLALPLAILFIKAFASINNSLIALNVPDLVTPLVREVAPHFGLGWVTYVIVISIIFHPFWWIALRLTAAFVRDNRSAIEADPLAAH